MNKQEANKIYQKEYRKKNKKKLSKKKKEKQTKYPWKRVLESIKYRCNNNNSKDYKYYGLRGIKCLITEEELKFLWFRDKAYEMDKPQISRKDHDKNYILDNCKFEEKLDNIGERNRRVSSKPIFQYDLDGNFIRGWDSASQVTRCLKLCTQNISKCTNGHYKQAHGFIWRFKNG